MLARFAWLQGGKHWLLVKPTVAPSFSMLPKIEPSSPPALLLGFLVAEAVAAWNCGQNVRVP